MKHTPKRAKKKRKGKQFFYTFQKMAKTKASCQQVENVMLITTETGVERNKQAEHLSLT